MSHPAVIDLPEAATSTLLGVCAQLSRSRHKGLARWAASVSNALLARLVSVTTGVHVDCTAGEPCPLTTLEAAELGELRALVSAGAEAGDDEAVARWCNQMNGLILADLWRRELEQGVIDARAAAMAAEERRLACLTRPDGLFAP